MHTIIGKPMKIKQNNNPSLHEILNVHKLYVDRLQELYDKHKMLYPQRKSDLNLKDEFTLKDDKKWQQYFDKETDLYANLFSKL